MAQRILLAAQCLRTTPFLSPWSISSTFRALLGGRPGDALLPSALPTQARFLRVQASKKPSVAVPAPTAVKPRSTVGVIGLNSIQDNPGARINRKRWGRGLGSGRGKRSGRGNKGWTNRHSGQPGPRGFEGGQTTFFHVVPKHGVRLGRPLRTYSEVNLDRLQHWIDMGRIDPKEPITVAVLLKSGCIPSLRDGVALLAQGAKHLTHTNLDLYVSRASAAAIRRVEELGGKITTSFLTTAEKQFCARPEKFAVPPRPSIPRDMQIMRHYLSESKRGNLTLEKVGKRAVIRLKQA